MWRLATFVAAFLYIAPAVAGQTAIPDYDTARRDYFWTQLYVFGGVTVYCSHVFQAEQARLAIGSSHRSLTGESLSIEHAYSAQWMAEANGCANRNTCDVDAYKFAEADLHNLWPAVGRINSSRGDLPFAEIPGEGVRRFEDVCPDYERTLGSGAVVEPQDGAKGDLARSIMYMMISYDLPARVPVDLLARWHFEDPPDEAERWRNNMIEQLQRTRNPLIDYPEVLGLVGQ